MAPTILVVEDDHDLRGMFRTALLIEGFHVLEADNGFAAFHCLIACRLPI